MRFSALSLISKGSRFMAASVRACKALNLRTWRLARAVGVFRFSSVLHISLINSSIEPYKQGQNAHYDLDFDLMLLQLL